MKSRGIRSTEDRHIEAIMAFTHEYIEQRSGTPAAGPQNLSLYVVHALESVSQGFRGCLASATYCITLFI